MVKTLVGIYTIVITIFVIGIWVYERLEKNVDRKRLCYWSLFCMYCAAVVWITLLSRQPQSERISLLVPFRSYPSAHQNYLDNVAAAAKDGIVSATERIRSFLYGYNWLVLNVLLFVPYGILAPKVFSKKKNKLIFYGILGSVSIELLQYIFRLGCFDVDDLIHNIMGIGVGYTTHLLLLGREGILDDQQRDAR